jgi:hydroxyacylglutathione hydrolase
MKNYISYLIMAMLIIGQQAFAQDEQRKEKKSPYEVELKETNFQPEDGAVIIDGRPEDQFKRSHLPGAINIMEAKFGEFLSKLVDPETEYYIVADDPERLSMLVDHADTIGYIPNLKGVFLYEKNDGESMEAFEAEEFTGNEEEFTIVDIRSEKEFSENPLFHQAINIPLPDLKDRVSEIPTDKPIVVHCGTGYRSAIGSSIVHHQIKDQKVLDMGSHVKTYQKKD